MTRVLLAVVLVVAGCASESKPSVGGGTLAAQVASFDLATGPETRLLVGLSTQDGKFISGGRVRFAYSQLDAPVVATTEAVFLPVQGTAPSETSLTGSRVRGVYAGRARFSRPGMWEVSVTAQVGSAKMSGKAAFNVLDKHQVPAPGDPAIQVDNLTVDSKDVPAAAIDSRAKSTDAVPDAQLHQTTVRAALAAKRPILLVISTPVYCQSRFCGPVTDRVAQLAASYGDKAAFVHIEVWRDRQNNVINKAAAEWVYRNGDLNEPWIFLIGRDGRIAARWDNVATLPEMDAALKQVLA